MRRLAGWGAVLVLMGTAFTACSDDDGDAGAKDEPTNTSESADVTTDDADGDAAGADGATRDADEAAFCAAMNDFYGVLGRGDAKKFEEARSALLDVGAPAVISTSAGDGYQLFIEMVDAMEPDDESVGEDLASADKKQLATFGDAYFKLCMDATDSEQFGESE
ncbi:hypothetical protein NODU109028_09210 [Nocardioides dubius]|uniref:hypothetical protein n=1 Tax=Nocardioides dubius TaxID=317019 RepID=UPI0031E293A4